MAEEQGIPIGPPKFESDPPATFGPRIPQRRPPSTDELIAYYSRNGLDRQAATEKALEDLQKALTIAVSRLPRRPPDAAISVSAGVDSLSRRLDALESKLDTKPGIPGVFVAGVAAGGFLQAVPHVLRAVSEIGQSLKQATSRQP